MPLYKYNAKDQRGQSISGKLEVENRDVLINELRKRQLIIISVEEVKQSKSAFLRKKISTDDLVIFARQLATMVDSGIPLVQSLDILGEQLDNKNFKHTIVTMRDDIQTGLSLSNALSKHPKVFSGIFINMVKAGESSGMLDEILDRLATFMEKSNSLKKKIKSALMYPVLVSIMAVAITAALLIFVIPKFKTIFDMFQGKLPLPTQILLSLSDNAVKVFGIGFLVFFSGGFLLSRYIKNEKGRFKFDKFKLKVPIFGKLLQMVAVARFCRTLSILIRSGVSILSSLDIVAKTVGNKVVETAVKNVEDNIREGKSIAQPLSESGVFPPMVVRMVGVGEQAGELEKMLSKIADFYEEQVDTMVAGLSSLIEPIIIIFLGLIIGSIVLSIFLPILKMAEVVGS